MEVVGESEESTVVNGGLRDLRVMVRVASVPGGEFLSFWEGMGVLGEDILGPGLVGLLFRGGREDMRR